MTYRFGFIEYKKKLKNSMFYEFLSLFYLYMIMPF